jgi:hypothetical protein
MEPFGRPSEEVDLIDGLWCPYFSKFRWPIGGQQQERYASLPRLDDRRMQFGGSRARGGDHRHRPPGEVGEAESEEGRGSFIVVDPIGDAGVIGEGQRQRAATRARRDAHVVQAQPDQGLDERGGERVVAVGPSHERPQYNPWREAKDCGCAGIRVNRRRW